MVKHSPFRTFWLCFCTSVWFPLHQWSSTIGALWVVCNYFLIKYSYEFWIFASTLPRDLVAGIRSFRAKWSLASQIKRKSTVPSLFLETVERFPDKIMMTSDNSTWTFGEARKFTDKVATYFATKGLTSGDEVALLMENRPEFILIWLGLSKLGVVTAMINYNLKAKPLAHCINAIKTKVVIFSGAYSSALESSKPHIDNQDIDFYHMELGDSPSSEIRSQSLLGAVTKTEAKNHLHKGTPSDRLLYIFTSGTTGMPKAAIVTHQRYMYCAANMFFTNAFNVNDKLYLSLPLYHNSGGTLGPGPVIIYGTSCHIARKFSASRFWIDCSQYNCTIALYIGEMVRYLLAQPKRQSDDSHSVRMIFGHGARKQLWEEFRNRFKVENIREIYGSTEGNAGLMNTDNKAGAIGFLPTLCRMSRFIAKKILPMHIIKVDESGKPIRDGNGLCIECGPNEPGEIIGIITSTPQMKFEGYVDRAATEKKIYLDIFERGERAFATSDIAFYDELGYVYFQDRTGDTFRWKSENVSTNEVESVIGTILGLKDAIVYGVEVEGAEGKAGMVSILNRDDSVDLIDLLRKMDEQLPSYAVPLFVRYKKEIESTSTLKYKKVYLVDDGFNPDKCKDDPLFFLDRQQKKYVPLDKKLYQDIISGKIRV